MAAAMSAWTRELEMRKRINSGTATMRVRVSPIGKFTLRSRSPRPWAASLSARGDDLVNVGTVDRHDAGGIQGQARGDVRRAPAGGQVPRPRRVARQAADVLAVGPRRRGRLLGGGRRAGAGLTRQQPLGDQAGAHVILERAGAPLPRAQQEHVTAGAQRPRGGRAEIHERGHADGGGAASRARVPLLVVMMTARPPTRAAVNSSGELPRSKPSRGSPRRSPATSASGSPAMRARASSGVATGTMPAQPLASAVTMQVEARSTSMTRTVQAATAARSRPSGVTATSTRTLRSGGRAASGS